MERRKPVVPDNRRNPLLFEADGDFNPGWLLFIVFSALGALMAAAAAVVAVLHEASWPALVAGLSFIAFAMLCTAIIVVPIAKAKLLTRLKNAPGDIASAAGGFNSFPYTSENAVEGDDG